MAMQKERKNSVYEINSSNNNSTHKDIKICPDAGCQRKVLMSQG
jgi:hypothetical protein